MQKTIRLDGLRLPVSIGIHEFERKQPQEYVLDIMLGLPDEYRIDSDDIAQAVNYDALRDQVTALLGSQHFNLQETVIQRVLDICFRLDDRVGWVDVRTRKTQVYPDCESVGLHYRVMRDKWIALTPKDGNLSKHLSQKHVIQVTVKPSRSGRDIR